MQKQTTTKFGIRFSFYPGTGNRISLVTENSTFDEAGCRILMKRLLDAGFDDVNLYRYDSTSESYGSENEF